MDCHGVSDFGFVFSDLWQTAGGKQSNGNAKGWVEAGTSYCDQNSQGPTWVAATCAWNGTDCNYAEYVLDQNAGNGEHSWVWRSEYENGVWSLSIDGSTRIGFGGHPANSYSENYSDTGLEQRNRLTADMPATVNADAKAWPTVNSSEPWSGTDFCYRTNSNFSGHWNDPDKWRYSINVNGLSNSSC